MQQLRQEPQLERPPRPNPKRPAIATIMQALSIIGLICFIIGLTFSVLSIFGLLPITWPNYLSIAFNTLAAIVTVLSALLSTSPRFLRWASSHTTAEAGPSQSFGEPLYSSISSPPPPTDPKAILQREEAVKQIYELLIQPEITAMVLTGIAGIGKSTLAALVYCYVENRRHQRWLGFPRGKGSFAAETLWLKVNPSMKMIDIAGTLFRYLGKPMPANFDTLPPQGQALQLTELLKTTKKPRLIVLDQFDTLFNIHTGDALVNHPGIGEWLDALNSQRCKCKILFTSCSWLGGAREFLRTHMEEYHVGGVSTIEGRELLTKHEVKGTDEDIRTVIDLCDGHMLALKELINLLEKYQMTLTGFLKSESYFQLWRRKIASHLLKDLYTRQLDTLERKLLSAFAVYRIAIPLDAAEAVLDSASTKTEILAALDVLLTQHLLMPAGEGDYELHSIVAHYIQQDLEESDEQSSYKPSRETHSKAANYCRQQAAKICPPQGQRRNVHDVHFLIETIWHLCQSEQWQEAYELMSSEDIADNLKSWGENTILLDLYQLLLPSDSWHPQDAQEAEIYSELGKIHTDMINTDSSHAEKALQYFKRSLTLYSEMGDYKGKCSILRNIGKFYLRQNQYEAAMAFFTEVEKLLKETQNSGGEEAPACKEELRRQAGEGRYDALLREIEPQAEQIVKKILS